MDPHHGETTPEEDKKVAEPAAAPASTVETDQGRVDVPVDATDTVDTVVVDTVDQVADESAAEEAAEPERNRVNPCITLDREVHEPFDEKKVRGTFTISLITRPFHEFDKVNQAAAGMVEELKSSPSGRDWLHNFSEGSDHYQPGGSFIKSLEREGSDWGQHVPYGGKRLLAGAPSIGGHGQQLSGNKAAAAMRAGMGTAAAISSPLWHSGLWMTITAPPDTDILILMHQIMDEKIALGNATVGLAFSSNSVFTARKLMEFIIPRIYASTTVPMDTEDLLKLIKITDYQPMLHMLGLTIYPHGFAYRRPCVNDIAKCEAVTTHHLNLSRILLVDRAALSVEQKHFMSDSKTVNSPEALLNYQQKGRSGMKRSVQLSDNIGVTFRVPSLYDWFEAGTRWIRNVEETVERAFGQNMSIKQKNAYLTEQSILTFLRQFSHWVAAIKDRDIPEYEDPETIDAMIGALSESEECMEKFIEELNKFIDDVTVAVTAIPAHDCPTCGNPQTVTGNPHPEAIPIDMQQVLFSLADQRTLRANIVRTGN